MSSRPSTRLPGLLALVLFSGFNVRADYNGTYVSGSAPTLLPGQSLSFSMTVRNTGSQSWPYGPYSWVHRIFSSDVSWSPKPAWSSTTGFHYHQVLPGATDTDTATIQAADLPSAPGTYSFRVYTYRPTDTYGSYTLMAGSPSLITFVIAGAGNRAPGDIQLSSASVPENAPQGTLVGALSALDPDPGDTHGFALASGPGDSGNSFFSIAGNTLSTAASFNHEIQPSLSVRVRATDSGGLTVDKVLTLTVSDVAEPAPVLRMERVVGAGLRLRWNSLGNHTYDIWESDEPNGPFLRVGAGLPATPPENTWVPTPGPGSRRYWKISTEP